MNDPFAQLWGQQPAQQPDAAAAPTNPFDDLFQPPQRQQPPWVTHPIAGGLPTPIGSAQPPRQAGIVDGARRVGAAFLAQVPGAVDMEEGILRNGTPLRYLPQSVQDTVVQGVLGPKRAALGALEHATTLPLTDASIAAERDRWRELGHGDTSPTGEAIADTAAEALGGIVLNPPIEGAVGALSHLGGAARLGEAAAREAPAAARAAESVARIEAKPVPLPPKLTAEMSPDELRRALLHSDIADLPNRLAFKEAQQTAAKPVVAMSDVDGLKHINDTFGHDAGDALIRAKADALRAAGVDAYHLSGDEFASRFDNPQQAAEAMARVKQHLAATPIRGVAADGSAFELKGVGFSHGIGTDLGTADAQLLAAKANRRSAGEAAARGEAPAYLAGVHDPGGDPQGLEADLRPAGVDPGSRRAQVGGRPPGELGHDFSTKGVTNVAGMRDELAQLADQHSELIDRARGGRQPVSQYHDAQALADQLGLTVDDFLKTPAGTVLGSRELALGRSLMGGLRDQIKELADGVSSGAIPVDQHGAAKDKIAATQADLVRLMATLHGQGFAEAGRTLRSAQEEVGSLASGPREQLQLGLIKRYREKLDGPAGDDVLRRISTLDANRPEDVVGFLRQMEKPTFRQYVSSYWFNSVLSGAKTMLRNGLGNVAKLATDTAMRPLEAGVDKVLAPLQGRERAHYVSETVPALAGLREGVSKGIERFAFIMRQGYDPERLIEDLSGEHAGKWEDGGRLPLDPFLLSPSSATRKAGAVLTMPTRLLNATDALFKAMAHTSESYAWATRQAIKDVHAGAATDVADRAAGLLTEQPEEMVKAARAAAAKATYTDPMSAIGKLAVDARAILNRVPSPTPIGDALLPFVHVSDRVAASITDFIPGAKPGKLVRLLKDGSPDAADLIARQAVGAALTIGGLGLAAAGRLTGSVPMDPKRRDDFYSEGRQPYSVLFGGRWVPMRDVLGPLAGPFVAAAAIHDQLREHPGEPLSDKAVRGALGSLETARYMLDASYLQTLQDVFSTIEDSNGTASARAGRGGVQAVARTASGYLPFSGLERNIATAADPRVVEKRSVADEIASGVPGLRNRLDARVGPQGNELAITTGRAGALSPVVPTQSQIADPQLEEHVQRLSTSLRDAATELNSTKARLESAMKSRQYDRAKELRDQHPEYRFAPWVHTQVEQLTNLEDALRRVRSSTMPPTQKAAIEIRLQQRMADLSQRALATIGRAEQQ